MERRSRLRLLQTAFRWAVYAGFATVVCLPIVVVCSLFFHAYSLVSQIDQELASGGSDHTIASPGAVFTRLTELPWPATARIESTTDSHGGFHGDGELIVAFQADPRELESWGETPPPWGGRTCSPGLVPQDRHDLGAESSALRQGNTLYGAQHFRLASIPWHNGRTLTVDLETGVVELFRWDY